MERFNRYEEEVLFEQKINKIQETNEFKLFAEERLNEEEFKSFLVESYGEELAENILKRIRSAGQKAALGATMVALGGLAAPEAAAAAGAPSVVDVRADQDTKKMGNYATKLYASFSSLVMKAAANTGKGASKEAFDEALKGFISNLKQGEDDNLITNVQARTIFGVGRDVVGGKLNAEEGQQKIQDILGLNR